MKYYLKTIIIVTFMFTPSYAADSLMIHYSGNPYFTDDILNSEIEEPVSNQIKDPVILTPRIMNRLLDFYSDKGFPLAVIKTDSLKTSEQRLEIYLNIESGGYVRLDKVEFRGNKITHSDALLRQSQIELRSRFSETELKNACRMIYKTGLFKDRPDFSILKTGNEHGILIRVEEKKYLSIMLMAGYSAGDTEDNISGIAEIRAENIFGTLRKAEIIWERNGGESENLNLMYREPFIFSYLIASRFKFDQKFRKDYFLSREYGFEEEFDIDTGTSVRGGMSRKTVYPDSLYSGSENDIVTDRYTGGLNYSTEDIYEAIPRSAGFYVDGEIAALNIDIKDSVGLKGIEVSLSGAAVKKISKSYFVKFSARYDHVIFNEEIPEFNRIYFGGASSLRGYREEFFRTDVFIKQSAEIYFVPDRDELAFSMFFDNAFYNRNSMNIQKIRGLSTLSSYGGGLIVQFRTGEVSAMIGIPTDAGFSESMIHVRYSVKF